MGASGIFLLVILVGLVVAVVARAVGGKKKSNEPEDGKDSEDKQ